MPHNKIMCEHVTSILVPSESKNHSPIQKTLKAVKETKDKALHFFRESVRVVMSKELIRCNITTSEGEKLRNLNLLKRYIRKEEF